MLNYFVIRLMQALAALLVCSLVIFSLGRASGDPVMLLLPVDATREQFEELRHELGLDRALPIQYFIFISDAVRGDFGESLRTKRPAMQLVLERVPNSLRLSAAAMMTALLIGIPLGVIAAVRRGSYVDTSATVVAVLGLAIPSFWLAILLVDILGVRLRLLPVAGTGGIDHYILPAFSLGWFVAAGVMRLTRLAMLEALGSEFVKLARIKGASERAVIWRHALRNALIPVVTFGAMYFAILISLAMVTEIVFAWPGVGSLMYGAILSRDFPVVQAVVLIIAAIVMVVNLIVDLLYAYLDPRIRYGRT